MKRLFFALMILCARMSAQAQTIHVDHHFWDGYSLYTVKEIRMGKYFYMITSQGDELTLEKVDVWHITAIDSSQRICRNISARWLGISPSMTTVPSNWTSSSRQTSSLSRVRRKKEPKQIKLINK